MHSSLLIVACLAALASAGPVAIIRIFVVDERTNEDAIKSNISKEVEKKWEDFMKDYGKSYKDEKEKLIRLKIFARHLETINTHNDQFYKNLTTFTMGINEFADLKTSEFVAIMTGYVSKNLSEAIVGSTASAAKVSSKLPDTVDWRTKGYVTPVKDQSRCGSCWAFSATGALEGQLFRTTRRLVSLSEQNLVDCSKDNNGCRGGRLNTAFKYIQTNGGIDSEDAYRYEAKDNSCRYNRKTSAATCKGFVNIPSGSESELQKAVASVGPISVGIDVKHASFQLYKAGIYNEPQCSSSNINHAVLVVGYGTSGPTKNLWIVKNSWGEKWGMKGYIHMSRDKNNQCGIATMASYPLV